MLQSSALWKPARIRASRRLGRTPSPPCAMWWGRIQAASTSEKASTGMTMRGRVPMRSPQMPGRPSSGPNAAMVVRTPNEAGNRTCRTPFTAAASTPVFARETWRCTFSPTTMASSTTIPRVRMNPNRVNMFTVTPSPGIIRKAPKKATGSPAAVQTASRLDRVKKRTRKMRARPCSPFRTRTSMRLSKSCQASNQGVTETPSGMVRSISRTSACTACAVSRRRAPLASITSRSAAGSPFMRADRCTSAKPSVTTATSPTVTTPPPGAAMRGIRAKSSPVTASASVLTRSSPLSELNGAARDVRRTPADRQRDLVERQPEAGEDVFGNLDRDLVVPPRGDLHRRHPGDRGERVPDAVRGLGEAPFVGVPVDRDPQQQRIHPHLRDHRFFGVRRQGREGLHPFPDLVAHAPEVGPPFHLDGEHADPLGREAGDLLHARDVVERLLESQQDAVLDHLGARAREHRGDGQGRGPRLGDHLLRDAAQGEQPSQRDPEQQEVGGHPVPDEPGDHARLRAIARSGGGGPLHPGVHFRTTRRPGSRPAGPSSPR